VSFGVDKGFVVLEAPGYLVLLPQCGELEAELLQGPDELTGPGSASHRFVDAVHRREHLASDTADLQGPVPWSIVRATQFHDFAAMVAGWSLQDGVATIAPLLVQPIAREDVAAVLAEIAAGPPLNAKLDIAGPETQDLVDMARRTFAARGQDITLVPTWRGIYGLSMASEVMLPGEGARLTSTTFDDWLAAGQAGYWRGWLV
jgi:uncharacterized protein YbjT (DUF2867 family)